MAAAETDKAVEGAAATAAAGSQQQQQHQHQPQQQPQQQQQPQPQQQQQQELRRALEVIQSMIDISADRLEGLRTQCSTSVELTQQEIRTLEGKLIKLFARLIITKEKLAYESSPVDIRQTLQQWLRVVSLTSESVETILSKVTSLNSLKDKSDLELNSMLGIQNIQTEEDLRRLCTALLNLRRYIVSSLQVPKSPRTPTVTRGMGHVINHRFTKTFKMMTTCDYCDKQMFIGTGLKCKECKYKCHRDCESKVPPSCGLPQELFDEFKRTIQADDVSSNENKGVTLETHRLENTISSDSDRTVSVSGSGSVSTDSERTPVRVDSQDSQVSDGEPGDGRWPRQNSLSIREWDIPFDELKIGEPIGKGRFGTVFRGNWHGDVAIKVLDMDYYLDDDKTLEAFKLEVATFRKTRHENLVLFMGACMKPPRLAIVTSMSKGMTLYTHIHLRKDKFNMNKTTIIAQQISQGMGYLHARGIVHKDLKSKNIFLENGKVVITDFGLFSVTKLCYRNRKGNGLNIPPGWLCYLAPEIIRRLRPRQNRDQEELPFTAASDVYAFG
ncbi:unnamed protein product [Trichogramma brassicae]|uniref:Protein kinase domain-containing protein n=1 Tax=Trichogramma brassicae TaxID=86971 RepID=A0A6H5I2E9_9HYME|nr:unnamed protein product [Trichogramma brassicae]